VPARFRWTDIFHGFASSSEAASRNKHCFLQYIVFLVHEAARLHDRSEALERDRFRWKQRRLVARSRFFSWSRDRTENRIPLFLITLWRSSPAGDRSAASRRKVAVINAQSSPSRWEPKPD
jgi:hypothetical protein